MKMKKWRVSWPSDSMLCQVKMFQTEDCPAKVGTQSCIKPKASNLPQGTEYSSHVIPQIRWNRPPKFILNDNLLVASGGESTETPSENLRIAKVLEAFYPHRSVIPTRPSILPAVQVDSYDDSKTPNIRLTPIEDENEPQAVAVESSQSSNAPASVFGLGTDLSLAVAAESSQSSNVPASVFGLGPDLSWAASAALSALMKTNEQGSLVDADLLVKLLSDPKIIKNLLNDTTAAKPLESGNNTTKPPPQHVTSSAMDRSSPPKPTITHPGNGVPHIVPVSAAAQPIDSVATQPLVSSAPLVFHTYPLSSGLKPLPRVECSLKPSSVDDVVVSEPQCQSLDISTSNTWNMSRVLESARTGTDAPTRNSAYPMNINRDDYFKNLIREHGGVTPATNGTNNYKGQAVNNNNKVKAAKVKIQKACMFFGRGRGCKLGESCLYLHDPSSKRLWNDVAAPEFPRGKRLKFGS